MMDEEYDPIEDWSKAGRAALLDEREQEIRLLLDLAFTTFLDSDDGRLSEFGFRGDDEEDPVDTAVNWCVEAFRTRDLDPAKLHPESRSFRIFTEVSFWLAQRVGKRAYDAIRARQRPSPDPPARRTDVLASEVYAVEEALGAGCRRLVRTTTSALLTWWLAGTEHFRWRCFEWDEGPEVPEQLSPKNASFAIADALWRYLCLFLDVVDESAGPAVRASLFSPCSPTFRYEVDKHAVASSLGLGVREMERQRRDEILNLVAACLLAAEAPLDKDDAPAAWVRIALARESVRDSLFHLYRIDRTCEVALRAKALPRGIQ